MAKFKCKNCGKENVSPLDRHTAYLLVKGRVCGSCNVLEIKKRIEKARGE